MHRTNLKIRIHKTQKRMHRNELDNNIFVHNKYNLNFLHLVDYNGITSKKIFLQHLNIIAA